MTTLRSDFFFFATNWFTADDDARQDLYYGPDEATSAEWYHQHQQALYKQGPTKVTLHLFQLCLAPQCGKVATAIHAILKLIGLSRITLGTRMIGMASLIINHPCRHCCCCCKNCTVLSCVPPLRVNFACCLQKCTKFLIRLGCASVSLVGPYTGMNEGPCIGLDDAVGIPRVVEGLWLRCSRGGGLDGMLLRLYI